MRPYQTGDMRDDRYRGTTLPKEVRKLCRMAEREADRAHPGRLFRQAVAALVSEGDREISPEFRRRLGEHDRAPSFFDASDLAESARSGLEVDIARNIQAGQGIDSTSAICNALRRRAERHSREQICQLIADRQPEASIASAAVKEACDQGALTAARRILAGGPSSQVSDRVRIDEDLLVRPGSGARP
jgi:hypothetical protein